MKSKEVVKSSVKELFNLELTDNDLEKDFEELGLDFLDIVELVMHVEVKIQKSFDDDDAGSFESFNDIVKYIDEL